MNSSEMSAAGRAAARKAAAAALRYGVASVGPAGGAAAQFVLSLLALHLLAPEAFGRFAFLMVAQQLSLGLWGALFCTPLPILLHEGGVVREGVLRCLFASNLLLSAVVACFFATLALVLGEALPAAALFGGYAATAVLRWFARSHAYATGVPQRTVGSDLLYAATLLGADLLFVVARPDSTSTVYLALAAAAVLGLLPFGMRYLAWQFLDATWRDLRPYGRIWQQHSKWSLGGVLSTEATANAHAYLVILIGGPGAFAPIAVSALVMRPISVVINALVDFERPQMALHLGQGKVESALRSARTFRLILLAAWLATVAAAASLALLAPGLLFPQPYDPVTLAVGAALWIAVVGVRAFRTPEGTLLQASGSFRVLASTSAVSSLVSVSAVAFLLVTGGPVWSIAGVLAGEIALALGVLGQTRELLRAFQVAA